MAKSAFYDATEEDSRPWVATHTAETKNSNAVANAATLQTETRATNPIDTITALPATAEITTVTTATDHTVQVTVSGGVGTVASDAGFSVTYASDSTAKATVSDTGLITAVGEGTATITVTAVHDTSVTDTVVATVVTT